MKASGSRVPLFLMALSVLVVSAVSLPAGASSVTYTPRSADPTPPKQSSVRFAGGKKANKVTIATVGLGAGGCGPSVPGPDCGVIGQVVISIFDSATNVRAIDNGPSPALNHIGCRSTISRLVICDLAQLLIVDLQGGDDYLALALTSWPCVSAEAICGPLESPDVSINGGAGNDSLRTLNLHKDTVTCGDGLDTVLADASDNVAPDCESVTRI